MFWSGTRDCEVSTSSRREYYIPSVDLLTAQVCTLLDTKNILCLFSDVCLSNVQSLVVVQDLLSFELLDINIVQELEKVPANTPVGKASLWLQLCNISSGRICSSMSSA